MLNVFCRKYKAFIYFVLASISRRGRVYFTFAFLLSLVKPQNIERDSQLPHICNETIKQLFLSSTCHFVFQYCYSRFVIFF